MRLAVLVAGLVTAATLITTGVAMYDSAAGVITAGLLTALLVTVAFVEVDE